MSEQSREFVVERTSADRVSPTEGNLSRHEIQEQLEGIGVDADVLESLSIQGLQSLREGISRLVSHANNRKPGRPKGSIQNYFYLSEIDKKILHNLMSSEGHVSSLTLSRKLGIPNTTLQRRKKRLEENLIEKNYTLRLGKLGWKIAVLSVSTTDGKTSLIGKEILEMDVMVASVTRMMGESTMDLKVDVIFKTTTELMSFLDRIKSMEGVKNVLWSESVEVIGKNDKCFQKILNSLNVFEVE